jgi:GDP-4-dehydro-6-deoxy-D-mannose reductase
VNTCFAANLLWALKDWGNRECPLILTGSSAEYGLVSEKDLPITEETSANPYDHYGISKLAQTLMGVRESRDGLPVIMIRPFNIIGPGMPDYLALQSFILQLAKIVQKRSEPIIDVGNLSTYRDFVDVRDVADVVWQLSQTPEAYGEVINVCLGIGTSIGELLNRLIEKANLKIEVRIVPHMLKPVDVPVHIGSNQKLSGLIGFSAKRDLDTTLLDMLVYDLSLK